MATLVACLGACAAPPDVVEPGAFHETVALTYDNDVFTRSDDNYTNGVALTWIRGPVARERDGSLADRFARLWRGAPFLGDDREELYVAMGLGHEIFTPDDITLADPPRDDQPYAGVLFVDLALARLRPDRSDNWQLRLGLVGPSSGAEWVQTKVHETIGVDVPEGWDTQLPDEPIINLDYTRATEWLTSGDMSDAGARVVPVFGAGAGTYFTGVTAGLYGEAGWNLPDPVGAFSLRQGVGPQFLGDIGASGQPSVSFFAGLGGYATAHYLPLDGTVFSSSRSVDTEPLVGFGSFGATVRYGSLSVTFVGSVATDQFATQRSATKFGSLTVAYRF
ncbi:lipid A deacylase LpxR family protein [Engelhardtia mirabilis]|uniref:Lipid A deacylase LpxR family protein n=1 Tax=Engelhardtia mirabilis TaxID=2528011 RepID=A0A518BLS1_9BACT|nr:hypothetical protein Pla133_30180 [Planctomycetes bacterium Pla133]QDV02255.1 hypothetical protein Pla86_30170 [Planctomycetes bacterium Pla86]